MGSEWAVVAAAAISGALALAATLIASVVERDREKRRRDDARRVARANAFGALRRGYAAAAPFLDRPTDNIWIKIVAAATDCIPYTAPDSEARRLLMEIVERRTVDLGALIDALPDEH